MDPLQNLNSVEKRIVDQAKEKHIPISGSMELSPLCNMKCNMCHVRMGHKDMLKKGGMRTAEEWLEIGRQMKEAGTLFLLLTGGEPLLYPQFKEVYLGLRKMGMVITIDTNGTLIDEEWAEFFAHNMPRRINITMYGVNNQAYEELCHYPDGFDKAKKAVLMLRERYIEVLLSMSVTPENMDDIEEYVELADELDCRCTFDEYMMPVQRERELPYSMQSRILPEEAALARVRFIKQLYGQKRMAEFARNIVNQIQILEGRPLVLGNVGFTCTATNCSFAVNWQGNMRPCTMLNFPSVSVFEHGVLAAWEQLVDRCSNIKLNRECVACKYRAICRTCVAGAYLETGDFFAKADYMCRYSKELFRLYAEEAVTCLEEKL